MCSLKTISEKSSLPNKHDKIMIPAKLKSNSSIKKKSRPRSKSRPLTVIPDITSKQVDTKLIKDAAFRSWHSFINKKKKNYPESKIPVLKAEIFLNEALSVSSDDSDRKFLKAKRKGNSKNNHSSGSFQDKSKLIINKVEHSDKTKNLLKKETFKTKNEELQKPQNVNSELISNRPSCVTVKKKSSRLKISESKSPLRKIIKPILKPVISELSDKKPKLTFNKLRKYDKDTNFSSTVKIKNKSLAGFNKFKNCLSISQIYASIDVTRPISTEGISIKSGSQNDRSRHVTSKPNGTFPKKIHSISTIRYKIPKDKKQIDIYQMDRSKLVTEMPRDKSNSLKEDDKIYCNNYEKGYVSCNLTELHNNNVAKCNVTQSNNCDLKYHLQSKVDQFVNNFVNNHSSNKFLNVPSMEVDPVYESCTKTSNVIKDFYVVIDTNVLIDDKNLLYSIRGSLIYHQILLKLVIPYIVLQELDNMKNKTEEVRKRAQTAIKWINSALNKENTNIIGQSFDEHLEAKTMFDIENGDDAILSCCLHYKKLEKCLILLSNDVNLRNKAIFSNVEACCGKQFELFISKLEEYGRDNKISQDCNLNSIYKTIFGSITDKSYGIKKDKFILGKDNCKSNSTPVMPIVMQDLVADDTSVELDINIEENIIKAILGKVLEHVLKDAYGNIWEKIVIIKPPWSAIDILKCIEKHWIAIFIDKFSNEFKIIILQLLKILSETSQCAERSKICSKKLSFLLKLIDKPPYKEILKSNKYIIIKLSNLTQSKITFFQHSVADSEVASANSSYNSYLNNNNEEYTKTSASCPHKDVFDNTSITEIACNDFTSLTIRNSIMKLGEHATLLMQSLITTVINDNEFNRFKVDSDVTSSLRSLRQTLVSFGFSMKSYTDGFSSSPGKISLCDQISNYWKLAGLVAPPLSFYDKNIFSLAHTNDGREFFICCIRDLEKIIQTIDTVLAINS